MSFAWLNILLCLLVTSSCKRTQNISFQLELSNNKSVITLTWNRVDLSKFNHYKVCRSNQPIPNQIEAGSGVETLATFVNQNQIQYADSTSSLQGITYYRVFAIDHFGKQYASNEVTYESGVNLMEGQIARVINDVKHKQLYVFSDNYFQYGIYDYQQNSFQLVTTSNQLNYINLTVGEWQNKPVIFQVMPGSNELQISDAVSGDILQYRSLPDSLDGRCAYLNGILYIAEAYFPYNILCYDVNNETILNEFTCVIDRPCFTFSSDGKVMYIENYSSLASYSVTTPESPVLLSTQTSFSLGLGYYTIRSKADGSVIIVDNSRILFDKNLVELTTLPTPSVDMFLRGFSFSDDGNHLYAVQLGSKQSRQFVAYNAATLQKETEWAIPFSNTYYDYSLVTNQQATIVTFFYRNQKNYIAIYSFPLN